MALTLTLRLSDAEADALDRLQQQWGTPDRPRPRSDTIRQAIAAAIDGPGTPAQPTLTPELPYGTIRQIVSDELHDLATEYLETIRSDLERVVAHVFPDQQTG